MTFPTLLVIFAFVCALLGVFGVALPMGQGKPGRSVNWIALALAFFFASLLYGRW